MSVSTKIEKLLLEFEWVDSISDMIGDGINKVGGYLGAPSEFDRAMADPNFDDKMKMAGHGSDFLKFHGKHGYELGDAQADQHYQKAFPDKYQEMKALEAKYAK